MKRWGLRHKGFRVGFIGVAVCSVFFVIGFAAPAWRNTTGLWMSCSQSHKMCVSHSNSVIGSPAWFNTVRTFESLGLIAVMLCIAAEVYMDFLSKPSPDRRLVELLALLAGVFGLVGSIIFAAFTPISHSSSFPSNVYLSWGFGLSTTSSCFFIAFASIIAYFRRRGLDVSNYSAHNAIHYQASDGSVVPQGLNSTDVAPPPYSEVVSQPMPQPGGGQGMSGHGPHPPQSHSEYSSYYKSLCLPDSEPPPAYYPPPPGGQFSAPPAYTFVPASSVPSSVLAGYSGHSSGDGSSAAHPPAVNSGVGLENPGANLVDAGATPTPPATPARSEPTSAPSGTETGIGGSPVMSSVPVYYVTVLGQMVPVFREELQQAGWEDPLATASVPAYFIMTQGQHVPVFSEEQARALPN